MTGPHDKHCFVAMPIGRTEEESTWYSGWYLQAIEPAVRRSGFTPILAVASESPVDITDELREHLAHDPMVIVDLGGMTPADEPNSNVMYELGIRHALGLPLVLLAWKSQRVPFDVNHQRVLMVERKMLFLDEAREKLCGFIEAAGRGEFYRPMDVVRRGEELRSAAAEHREPFLANIANELRDIRSVLSELGPSAEGNQPFGDVELVEKIGRWEPLSVRESERK